MKINLAEINTLTNYFGNKIQNNTDTPCMKYLYNKLLYN